jgi:hypothetical protein
MRQLTFANQSSFEKYARKSRREEFLNLMTAVVPWRELEALIEPHYPKAGNGRQPVGLSIMLRVYFLQQWFNLSDPGAEDALYESPVLRRFAGVDLPPHRRRPVRGGPGWVARQPPTRPRFFASAACWSSMNCPIEGRLLCLRLNSGPSRVSCRLKLRHSGGTQVVESGLQAAVPRQPHHVA